MAITSVRFQNNHDIHVLAGQTSPDLRSADYLVLDRRKADGTSESIWAADNTAADEVVRFKPLFKGVQNGDFFEGFGVRVNTKTGQVIVTKPLPAVRKHNFVIEVEGENMSLPAGSPDRKKTTFTRVHVHQSIAKVWLTPSTLTIRQYQTTAEAPFPQTTVFKFGVHAQFDDDVVADITTWPGLSWLPNGRVVANSGRLILQAADAPGNTFPVTVSLPAALGGMTSAAAQVRIGDPWVSGPSNQVDIVPGGGWPGTLNPDVVPNVLFLCDGYGSSPADKEFFKRYVSTLVTYMKQNPLNRPYDVLATSINFWCGFLPSATKGVTIRGEVFPRTIEGVQYGFFVPGPDKPPTDPATAWNMSHVIYTVGLPVRSHEGKSNTDIRTEWTQKLSTDPNAKITDQQVERWKEIAKRSLVDAVDTPLGVACGDPVSDMDYNLVTLDRDRMNRDIMDKFLGTLVSSNGINLQNIWLRGARDAASDSYPNKSNNYDLVCIIPAGIGRAQNEDGFFFVNPLGFNKIAIKELPGTKAFMLDETHINLPASADDEQGRLLAHELTHSFFIGDEYWDYDATSNSTSAKVDSEFANLQAADGVLRAGQIHGDEIKWNWHRIYKAAVLSADLPDAAGGEWKVNLRLGQGFQFAVGDTVHFRFRIYPKGPEKNPKISVALAVTEKSSDYVKVKVKAPATDTTYPTALNYPAGSLVQPDQFKATFKAGSILYIPKPAPESVRNQVYCAEMVASNIKKFITDNHRPLTDPAVKYPNSEEQQPNFEFSGALSKPDLPDCFSRNRPRIVGLYEGGMLYRKGIYHPTGNCIMRDNHTDGREFCAVCRYILVDIIDPYKHWEIDQSYEKIYPQR
jgi:hypothetical protein